MSNNQWITYILKKKNDELYTLSDKFNESSVEHQSILKSKDLVTSFKGEDLDLTIEKANKAIIKIQKEKIENISFAEIKKINTVKPQESYVLFPNNQGYKLQPIKSEEEN